MRLLTIAGLLVLGAAHIRRNRDPRCLNNCGICDAECWEVVSVVNVCPQGSAKRGGDCIRSESFDAEPYCPQGQLNARENRCEWEDVMDGTLSCRMGFQLEGCDCVRREEYDAEIVCPPGLTPNLAEGTCGRIDVHDASFECPPGLELVGGNCVSESEVPAELRCPGGLEMNESGQCVKILNVPVVTQCYDNEVADNGNCRPRSIIQPSSYCPDGSILEDEHCRIREYREPIFSCMGRRQRFDCMQCASGFRLVGTACERERRIPRTRRCPRGARLREDGACEEVGPVSSTFACPVAHSSEEKICRAVVKAEVQAVCPEGYTYNERDGMCRQRIVKDARVHCEFGELCGGICRQRVAGPLQVVCHEGDLVQGTLCVYKELELAQYSCPKWSRLSPEGVCVNRQHGRPSQRCPPGSTLVNGRCSKDTIVPSVDRCGEREVEWSGVCQVR